MDPERENAALDPQVPPQLEAPPEFAQVPPPTQPQRRTPRAQPRQPAPEPVQVQEPTPQPLAPQPQAVEPGLQPSQLVPLKMGRREVLVPQDVADAYAEREQDYARGITQDRAAQAELERLRQLETQVRQISNPQPQAPQPEDITQIWYTDPVKAMNRIKQETKRELEQQFGQVMAERDFWDNFYRVHPHYREDERLVKMLAQENLQGLMALPNVSDRIERLGQMTGNEILRIARRVKIETPTAPAPQAAAPAPRPAERPSGERLPVETTPEDEEEANLPQTLGAAIRMQRIARQGRRR
jgi:hypothetical protein